MKLRARGENPEESAELKHELVGYTCRSGNERPCSLQDRIREMSTRLKLLDERLKAAKVDVPAAGRFIKHALWEPKEKQQRLDEE